LDISQNSHISAKLVHFTAWNSTRQRNSS